MTFDRKKYKDFASIQLKDRWTVPVLMTLFTTLLLQIFSIPANLMSFDLNSFVDKMNNINDFADLNFALTSLYSTNNLAGAYIISILETLVGTILSFASYKVYLKMSFSNEKVSFKTFIEGFNYWGRSILCELWMTLWIFLWMLIAIGVTTIFSVIIAIIGVQDGWAVATVLPIVMIAGFIPAIIRALRYSMTPYICVEFPEISIRKALKISIKITEGHVGDIFVTILSFIGWWLLGIISFGVANLWITPYYTMTMVNVYHALLKGGIEEGKISISDLKNEEINTTAPQEQKTAEIQAPVSSSNSENNTTETNVSENNSSDKGDQ